MALFTSYSRLNRNVMQVLTTDWTRERVFCAGSNGYKYAVYHQYTRIRNKRYQYFGMTSTAAQLCYNAMVAYWTRKFNPQVLSGSTWSRKYALQPTSLTGYDNIRAATFSCDQIEGDNYAVTINVNEELVYNHTPTLTDSNDPLSIEPAYWLQFEANPNLSTNNFKGWVDSSSSSTDYLYDD